MRLPWGTRRLEHAVGGLLRSIWNDHPSLACPQRRTPADMVRRTMRILKSDWWGPFVSDLDPAELRARLWAMRALVRVLTGPRGADLDIALYDAETDESALGSALTALDRLTPVDRRMPTHHVTKHLQQGIESDHFRVKRAMPRVGGFRSFATARRTIQGFEAMLWLRKGFGFAGAWTIGEQNHLLATCFGLPLANKA
ncbi:DDE-type integrase/transposase/recombinase [Methylobacterium tarhaniae]|uniref:DDE-type integrase/transposase/recombinase n=1 Tax=Methylobacterium tarhaniae TaxID=1187852 RepID=UPI003CFFC263